MALLNKKKKILVVGLGMIGGSYAQGLSRLGYEVGAIDPSEETTAYAVDNGIVAHAWNSVEKDYVRQFDIIVFAVYPKVIVEWIKTYQDFFKSGAIITDVTGVKRTVVEAITPILREDVDFVPAHPMAGREVYGVKNCNCDIFHGANFIITPTSRSSEEAIETISDIARLLGFKNISTLSPEEHDEMIGFLSQLTHCIAVALMDCKDSLYLAEYTGDSFRDLTRIARINENMWSELFLENRDELLSQMDLFLRKFTELHDALYNGDTAKMKEMMRLSTLRRSYFDK